jgi:glycosyltransferase involved in cell wall biosynthesis
MIRVPSPATVEVLLSTHNGERYIEAQLASILSQSYADLRVVVRDDGSTDRTVELLQEMAAEDSRVRVVQGARLGWAHSFMELLANGEARWFAFSDQDDLWLPDKIARAVAALEPLDDRPALYGSAMLHVSGELRWLTPTTSPRRVSFENAIVQNVLPGCTMVLNRAARALCLEGLPRNFAHDWWLYAVVSAFGTVVFDEAATVLHRVHANNATLLPLWSHWPNRVAAHFKLPPERRSSAFAGEFHEAFGDRLDRDRRAIVDEFLAMQKRSWWSRARYAWRPPVYRQNAVDDLLLRVLLALGRF